MRTLNVCNLLFHRPDRFQEFPAWGYVFRPLVSRLPVFGSLSSEGVFKFNRVHLVTAHVVTPPTQPNSIIYRGGRRGAYLRKLLEDILTLCSILTGRNVVLWADRKYPTFPPTSRNHCVGICPDSGKLQQYLERALVTIHRQEWQTQFEDAFHVRMFYHTADVVNDEARFLSNMRIWEFLYARNTAAAGESKKQEYDRLRKVGLHTKLAHLAGKYILKGDIEGNKLSVFAHLRNQLAHYGSCRLPNPTPRSGSRN